METSKQTGTEARTEIVWEWYDDSKWNAYIPEHQKILEEAYSSKKKDTTMKIFGNNYKIHFNEMKQENLSSRFKRNMRRNVIQIKGVFEVEQRFQTHISTDKTLYKLNDTVYVRGVLLSFDKQKPLSDSILKSKDFYLGATFQILGPKGDVIVNTEVKDWNNSVLSSHWVIPQSQSGGEYVAKFIYKGNGLPAAERKFEIRAFQNPRLNSQIQFLRKGFGPGDKAVATLKVDRAEGGPCSNAKVTVKARVDGVEVHSSVTKLNENGSCLIGFNLPNSFKEGDGTLNCVIEDQGVVETASKTIPILMNTIDVKCYPEGGDLIEGLECGFYIECFTKSGDPADLLGEIVDQNGNSVTQLNTIHEGRGKTVFTPKNGNSYSIKVSKPSGIKNISIPKAKESGCSLMSTSNIFECDDALSFKFGATKSGKYLFTIYKKEIQLTRVNVKVKDHNETVPVILTLPTDVNADGVLRVTVTDSEDKPVAERLIFRKQTNKLKVDVVTDYKSFCPGDKVKLRLLTTDESGKAVSAKVCVTVTDESVRESVEKRKHHPNLDAMVYLEKDVDHLDDATIYLSNDPIAEKATDLLLGTQGWRRFAYTDIMSFIKKNGEKSEKVACIHQGEEKPYYTTENPYLKKKTIVYEQPKVKGRNYDTDTDTDTESNDWSSDSWGDYDDDKDEASDDDVLYQDFSDLAPPPKLPHSTFSSAPAPSSVAPMVNKAPPPMKMREGLLDSIRNSGVSLKRVPEKELKASVKTSDSKSIMSELSKKISTRKSTISRNDKPRKLKVSNEKSKISSLKPPVNEPKTVDTVQEDLRESLNEFENVFGFVAPSTVSTLKPAVTQDIIREYAFKISQDRKQGSRVDFTETIYWCAVETTDENGRLVLEFDLSDSITSFRASVDAFTDTGIIGCGTKLLSSKEPFYIEPKIPMEVSSGDYIKMPIAMVNGSNNDLDVKMSHEVKSKLLVSQPNKIFGGKLIEIESESRKRSLLEFEVKEGFDFAQFSISGDAGAFNDKVTRKITVVPSGFPNSFSVGSVASENGTSLILPIPENVVDNSLKATLTFYPSSLSNLSGGLQSLLKYPHGCFEQTASTTYPTVMAHQYFISHQNLIQPNTIQRSYDLIQQGHKKLISFECKDGGFEWFGNGSAHEGLTALGVLLFTEMKKVFPVNEKVLSRATEWLLARKDGKGSFVPNNSKSYEFGGYAPEHVKVAYIVWALSEAGIKKEIEKEIDCVYTDNKGNNEGYTIALCGNALYNLKRKEGIEMAKKLSKLQQKDGSVSAEFSITGSGGISRLCEATALSVLCWLNDYQTFTNEVQLSLRFLHNNSKNGKFGNTQGTCLALKAIIKYDEMVPVSTNGRSGLATIIVDSEKITQPISSSSSEPIEVNISKQLVKSGNHSLEIEMSSGCTIPYSLSVDYHSTKPDSSFQAPLHLSTKLSETTIKEGEGSEIKVEMKNLKDEKQGMSMAIVGVPGGLEVRHDQLKELVKSEVIDSYEIIGRNIAIYKKSLAAKETLKFKIDVVGRIPGKYVGPSSRSYLYYTDEDKQWIEGLKCEIIEI